LVAVAFEAGLFLVALALVPGFLLADIFPIFNFS